MFHITLETEQNLWIWWNGYAKLENEKNTSDDPAVTLSLYSHLAAFCPIHYNLIALVFVTLFFFSYTLLLFLHSPSSRESLNVICPLSLARSVAGVRVFIYLLRIYTQARESYTQNSNEKTLLCVYLSQFLVSLPPPPWAIGKTRGKRNSSHSLFVCRCNCWTILSLHPPHRLFRETPPALLIKHTSCDFLTHTHRDEWNCENPLLSFFLAVKYTQKTKLSVNNMYIKFFSQSFSIFKLFIALCVCDNIIVCVSGRWTSMTPGLEEHFPQLGHLSIWSRGQQVVHILYIYTFENDIITSFSSPSPPPLFAQLNAVKYIKYTMKHN